MPEISAQVSLYPLRQEQIAAPIDEVIELVRERGLLVEPGAMATVLSGDDEEVLGAIRDALRRAAAHGEIVLVVTLSNACPVPGLPAGE